MSDKEISNREIAEVLERIAELLEARDANPFRVRAYRNGAQVIRTYDQPIAELVRRQDASVLQVLPQIGEGLSAVIGEYVEEGHSRLLEQLQSEVSPVSLFATVPGIGKTLAQTIVRELEIDTLEELKHAANDGRLAQVAGFGKKRVDTVRAGLNELLSRGGRGRVPTAHVDGDARAAETEKPDIADLLDVDEEYRRRAAAEELAKIAPRRFNPEHKAWLPILHTKRGEWEFTALYSNTAQAHELDKTHDWVVIYYEREDREQQATVVTPANGKLKGKRVVRGREVESARYYASQA